MAVVASRLLSIQPCADPGNGHFESESELVLAFVPSTWPFLLTFRCGFLRQSSRGHRAPHADDSVRGARGSLHNTLRLRWVPMKRECRWAI